MEVSRDPCKQIRRKKLREREYSGSLAVTRFASLSPSRTVFLSLFEHLF